MESRFRVLFLIVAVFSLPGCAATKSLFGFGDDEEAPPPLDTAEPPGQVIEPAVERREIEEPKIDREDFEVGAFVGVMSIEDFGSDIVYGARLAYHMTEGFLRRGHGRQHRGRPDELRGQLSGGARLLTPSERELTYVNLNLGYNILPGEVFLGEGRAFNTNLLPDGRASARPALLAMTASPSTSAPATDFLLNDFLALHVDFRDHLFDIDVIGEEKDGPQPGRHHRRRFTVFF